MVLVLAKWARHSPVTPAGFATTTRKEPDAPVIDVDQLSHRRRRAAGRTVLPKPPLLIPPVSKRGYNSREMVCQQSPHKIVEKAGVRCSVPMNHCLNRKL